MSNDRFSRQANFVPALFQKQRFLVVGCGAVGRNIVMTLASMGCKDISVYDFDKVELHNCASQGWEESDVGKTKITAITKKVQALYKGCKITGYDKKWAPDYCFYDIIFTCADCMNARKAVFQYYTNRRGSKPIIIDSRMKGEEMRILMSWDKTTRIYHKEQFFTNDEAADGSCATQTTLYSSNIIASLSIQKAVSFFRDGYFTKETLINLSSCMTIHK